MLQGLSFAQKKHLAERLGNKSTQTKWNQYYSRIRLSCTSLVAAAGSAVYTIAAGTQSVAFSYGRGGSDMASAGLGGILSTPADTNILLPNQTIAGESVIIEGVGLISLASSDANLLKQADQNISVIINMNGSTDYLLGIPSMVPSPGGLFGASEAWSTVPSLAEQFSRGVGVLGNGIPHISNYLPLPEPMLWSSAGRGDSSFNIRFKAEHTINTIGQFGNIARVAAAGIAVYNPPTAAQTFVDYMVVLVGPTVNPLSTN